MATKEENRGSMVSVRFADDEITRLRAAAERSGVSVSAQIRRAVLEMAPQPLIQVGSLNVGLSPDVFPTVQPSGSIQVNS